MKNWTKTARAAGPVAAGLLATGLLATAVFAAGGTATLASAQTIGQEQARGVMVLRPTEAPAPVPTPLPAPTPTPTPVPTPLPLAVRPAAPVIKPCPRPFARADLVLGSGASFDRRLRTLLAARRGSVIVDLAAPYPVDAAPPAPLSPWLDNVKGSGGLVTVDSYCQASRGLFGNFLKKMFGASPDAAGYAAAAGYDAVLHVDGTDQRVTQVQFVRRTAR